MSPAATDLSPAAIRAREKAREAGQDGGASGRELIAMAGRVFDEAKKLRKIASRRGVGRRRDKLEARADDALRTAAAQIRLAQICPLDRPYLHALTLDQIQDARDETGQAYATDPAALAVDTHRRIQQQRSRAAAGGTP